MKRVVPAVVVVILAWIAPPAWALGGGTVSDDSRLVLPLFPSRGAALPDCSGAALAPRIVVTAAHCLIGSQTGNRIPKTGPLTAGRMYVGTPGSFAPRSERIQVLAQFLSPLYRPSIAGTSGPRYDFGVLILAEPVDVETHDIASADEIKKLRESGAPVTVFGYGFHSYQETISGRDGHSATAQGVLRPTLTQTPESRPDLYPVLIAEMFAEIKWPPGIYTGGGDSGGPVWVQKDGIWIYLGPISAAQGPSATRAPDDPIWNDPYWANNAGAAFFTAQAFPDVLDQANRYLGSEIEAAKERVKRQLLAELSGRILKIKSSLRHLQVEMQREIRRLRLLLG